MTADSWPPEWSACSPPVAGKPAPGWLTPSAVSPPMTGTKRPSRACSNLVQFEHALEGLFVPVIGGETAEGVSQPGAGFPATGGEQADHSGGQESAVIRVVGQAEVKGGTAEVIKSDPRGAIGTGSRRDFWGGEAAALDV